MIKINNFLKLSSASLPMNTTLLGSLSLHDQRSFVSILACLVNSPEFIVAYLNYYFPSYYFIHAYSGLESSFLQNHQYLKAFCFIHLYRYFLPYLMISDSFIILKKHGSSGFGMDAFIIAHSIIVDPQYLLVIMT